MLRAFFLLLPVIADYETVTGIAQVAFRLGVVNASIFACSGVPLALRHWLRRRKMPGLAANAAAVPQVGTWPGATKKGTARISRSG